MRKLGREPPRLRCADATPGSGKRTKRKQKELKSEPAAQLPGTVFDVEFAAGIMELVYKSVEFFKMKPDFLPDHEFIRRTLRPFPAQRQFVRIQRNDPKIHFSPGTLGYCKNDFYVNRAAP